MVARYATGVLFDDEGEGVAASLEEVAEGVGEVAANWLRNEVVGN